MDVIEALELPYERASKLLAELDGTQMGRKTPCADWDVRALLNHLVGCVWMFTLVNEGQQIGKGAGDVIGDDPLAAFSAAAQRNLGTWKQKEAFEGDRTFPFGTFPAPAAALVNLEEVVLHT